LYLDIVLSLHSQYELHAPVRLLWLFVSYPTRVTCTPTNTLTQ